MALTMYYTPSKPLYNLSFRTSALCCPSGDMTQFKCEILEGNLPSRNPGYAHEMRSTYDKMTYAHCTYLIGKNNLGRMVAPCLYRRGRLCKRWVCAL